jgi:hypothetical protein
MIKVRDKARKGTRHRDGYDPPLLVYLRAGQREALRKISGPRSEARIIRELVADAIQRNREDVRTTT